MMNIETYVAQQPKPFEGRDAILFHTATLIREIGYAATTVREIATAAGMKSGSIYYHFASKDEIIDEVMRKGLRILNDAFNDALSTLSPEATGRDTIEAAIRSYLAAIVSSDPSKSTYLGVYPHLPPILKKRVRRERRVYGSLWVNLFTRAQRDGSITPGLDPYLSAAFVLGTLNRVIEWYNPATMDTKKLIDFLAERLLFGFAIAPPDIKSSNAQRSKMIERRP